jgi:hypothetical protein
MLAYAEAGRGGGIRSGKGDRTVRV